MKKSKIAFLSTLALGLLLAACGSPTTVVIPTGDVTGRTAVPTSVSTPTTEAAAADMPSATKGATPFGPSAVISATPVSVPTTPGDARRTVTKTPPKSQPAATKTRESGGRIDSVHDFGLVAYQGEELLGGRETIFSETFEQGKPVVLNFWAGNCPPCRFEMPSFQAVADKYDGEVVFLGVDVGLFTGLGDHESARQLLDELDVRYPSAYAVDASPLQQYKVVNMPTTVFFDSHGSVVARRAGIILEDELSDIVDELVAGS